MRSLADRVGSAERNRLPSHTAQLEFRPRDRASKSGLATAAGLEPASLSFEGWCSIGLSDAVGQQGNGAEVLPWAKKEPRASWGQAGLSALMDRRSGRALLALEAGLSQIVG